MPIELQNVVKKVRCWWKTPSPLFPTPSHPREQCNTPVWFPDDFDGDESTVPISERVNRPIIEHGVDTGNFDMMIIPVTAAGFLGAFDVNGDGISLVSRVMDQSGELIESSATARIYIRVNSERALGMPFSFLNDPFGAQKCDLLSLAARVQRVWIYCDQPTQDTLTPNIVVVFTKGIGISGLFGSAGFATGTPASPAISAAGGGAGGGVQGGGSGGSGPGGGGVQGGGGGGHGRQNQL